jgi:hypothetical protein
VRELLGSVDHVIVSGEELVEGRFRLIEQGAAWRELGLLAEKADARPGVQAGTADVRLIEAREDLQERCLADSVRANEPDPLPGVQLEADIPKERPAIKTT